MSSSNKGFIFVIAAGVALAGAFAAVYFLVLAPRSERKRAQGEVEAWGSAWQRARTCLVGAEPRSQDGFEAYILREALSGEELTVPIRDCVSAIKELDRPSGYHAGAEVEAAWQAIDEAWKKLAQAQAWRGAKTPQQPIEQLRVDLASAIPPVDRAYRDLRAAAGLSVPPEPTSLTVLAAGAPLTGPDGMALAADELSIARDAVGMIATTGDQRWIVRKDGREGGVMFPFGEAALPAIDGSGWGAWIKDDGSGPAELRSGTLDAQGDPADDGVLVTTLERGQTGQTHFALTEGDVRVIVYQVTPADGSSVAEYIARSRDGGATWPENLIIVDGRVWITPTVNLPLGRLDLTWATDTQGERWLPITAERIDGPLQPITVAAPTDSGARLAIGSPCVAGELVWWRSEGYLYVRRTDDTGPSRPVPGSGKIGERVSCDGERAVSVGFPEGNVRPVLVCSATGCASTSIPYAWGATAVATMSEKHGPLVAVVTNGVLVLWSGDPDKKQAFEAVYMARLPAGHLDFGMVEWDGVPHLITQADDAVHAVALGGFK